MVRYYKVYDADGYLFMLGIGNGGIEITEEEYNYLRELCHNRPAAPEGYEYRINVQNEYVLVEVEPLPEPNDDDELTEDEAWDIIMGGAV